MIKIRPRIRDAVIQSLRAGVTPKLGLSFIQVGRLKETQALLDDIERIVDGGGAFRIIEAEYGAGKTFFMCVASAMAHQKQLVVSLVDMSPDKRLYASNGQARALYSEIMAQLTTSMMPDGGALEFVITRFFERCESDNSEISVDDGLAVLQAMPCGFEYAQVLKCFWRGHQSSDAELKSQALRWLRGEMVHKRDAFQWLKVRSVITDGNVFDHLKIFARFTALAGFGGLLIGLDEAVNMYKLPNSQARRANYEQVLRYLNSTLQGNAPHLGMIIAGTRELVHDEYKGFASYEALRSRLSGNAYAKKMSIIDLTSPVMALENLSPEECFILLQNLRHVFASGDPSKYLISDKGIEQFLIHCHESIGASYFRTPRQTIRGFLDALVILDQNPEMDWQQLFKQIEVTKESSDDGAYPTSENTESDNDDGSDALGAFQL
ncbi:ATP-binding protein [Vibrio splendidus]